jgi:hypothetical protein
MEQASDGVDRLKARLGAEAAAANIELCFDAAPDLPAGPSMPPTWLDEVLRLPPELISRPDDNRGRSPAKIKHIVSAHGASLHVESRPERDATVSFQLPAAKRRPAGR